MDKRFHVSQYGQCEVIDRLCYPQGDETHVGTFLEVGAWDGVDISNCYWLEKRRGWTGLLVEPIPERAAHAQHNRWSPVWEGCVWDKDGSVAFLRLKGYSEMLSVAEEGYQPSYRVRIDREVQEHKQETVRLQLPSRTLNSLMAERNLSGVDILSLDCQTAELRVLQGYDPERHPIKAILVDYNGCNREGLDDWFKAHGYQHHWKHQSADEYLFVHPDVRWSWEKPS
jgi:FkbM family methyltransferase